MVLDDEEIRCTSVPGHRLSVGSDFTETLLNDLSDTSVVIGLITRNSLASSWVLFELGATWGARKALRPLVSDEVDLKSLPGALAGRHVAKLSKTTDVVQLLDELITSLGAKARSRAKIDKAVTDLVRAHADHLAAASPKAVKSKVSPSAQEPLIAGVPFSEVVTLLRGETVTIPAKHAGGKGDVEITLLDLFVNNSEMFAAGLQSNYKSESAGEFMYRSMALPLLPYGLVQFEKLPAAQAKWFKRIGISADGNKFLLHYKRLASESRRSESAK